MCTYCIHSFIILLTTVSAIFTSTFHAAAKSSTDFCHFNREKEQIIVIIGSGPTGLGALHRLYELGVLNSATKVIALEQNENAGGLASSYRDDKGFLWDNGGHVVFSHYDYFNMVVNRAVANWNLHTRASFVYLKGTDGIHRFIPYPLQNNVHLMDKEHQQQSLRGLENLNPVHHKINNFDEWLLTHFGEGLYEIFFRKYNHKVWTVDPIDMNAKWVGERIAVSNITEIKAKVETAAFQQEKQSTSKNSKWGPNYFFQFPKYEGSGGLWGNVSRNVPHGWLHFGQKVVSVDVDKKLLEVEPYGESAALYTVPYDYVISTAPLDKFAQMINSSDFDATVHEMKNMAKKLMFTHTHIIGIGLKGRPPQILAERSWMYFPDNDCPFYRITLFSNYSTDHVPDAKEYWSLMCEVAEHYKSNWSEEKVIQSTIDSLIDYKFIQEDQIFSKYYRRLEHGYPIPSLERDCILNSIQTWLSSKRIYSRGRFGGWKYEVGNQDHSFMQGVEVADYIMTGAAEVTYYHPDAINGRKNNRAYRVLNCSVLPPVDLDYEFVIAHYNENLDWLEPYANHCHIYHKGDVVQPNFSYSQWEKLPNVGREAHTYLYHIIQNYNRLAEVTIFLQAGSTEHPNCFSDNLMKFVSDAHERGLGRSNSLSQASWGKIQHIEKWLDEYKTGRMRPAKHKTLLDFYRNTVTSAAYPPTLKFIPAACFSVVRDRIHRYPIETYKKMLNTLDDHVNPEEGHYMERLWLLLFR